MSDSYQRWPGHGHYIRVREAADGVHVTFFPAYLQVARSRGEKPARVVEDSVQAWLVTSL